MDKETFVNLYKALIRSHLVCLKRLVTSCYSANWRSWKSAKEGNRIVSWL